MGLSACPPLSQSKEVFSSDRWEARIPEVKFSIAHKFRFYEDFIYIFNCRETVFHTRERK
jgi:hypothetical protein